MQTGYKTLAGLAYFFRDGAAYTLPEPGGNAGREIKPGADDPAWLNLGHVDIKTKNETEFEEIIRNVPGARTDYDAIPTKKRLLHTITLHELQNLVYELLFGSLNLTAAGQYNPLEGGAVKGWLKVQEYDGDNALINTHDVFVHLGVPGELARDDKHVAFEVPARVLFSTKNTGTLAANPA